MDGLYQSIYRRFQPDIGDNGGTKEGCVINEVKEEQEISPAVSLYSLLSTHTDHALLVEKFNSACFTYMVLDYAGEQGDERKMYVRNRKDGTG